MLHRIELSHVFLLGALVSCGGAGYDPNQLSTVVDGSAASADDGGRVVVTTDGGTVSNTPPTPYTDPFANAPPFTPGVGPNGKHNEGRDCLQSGCHDSNGDGPAFLIGGTIYSDYAGKVPLAGAEIRIVDKNGKATSTYSANGGNFYISAKSGVAFPVVVGARTSSSTRPMITPLTTGAMGGCAYGGCHGNGIDPIHVP